MMQQQEIASIAHLRYEDIAAMANAVTDAVEPLSSQREGQSSVTTTGKVDAQNPVSLRCCRLSKDMEVAKLFPLPHWVG